MKSNQLISNIDNFCNSTYLSMSKLVCLQLPAIAVHFIKLTPELKNFNPQKSDRL
ncbi:hypothetical protein [Pseudanabaena sp. SR411]|uniref:hypothetical protein n=1 Tax=Pseudanabaena sp. SR411 TaxID=1980935 RepID=UPI00159628AC|nr:hypothetical protein [Pseudanabaena sp. SR411]